MAIIFNNGETTDIAVNNSDVEADPGYPTDISNAEKGAGYGPIIFSNPSGHHLNASPYLYGVGKEIDEQTVKIKVKMPDGQIRYSERNRENLSVKSELDFEP